mgnify:CR=1 FL=1
MGTASCNFWNGTGQVVCALFFFGKRADVLQHIGNLAENETGFAHIALEAAFSKV